MAHDTNTSSCLRNLLRTHQPTLFTAAVIVFGLLLWARFLLVTGHPRTAIADPAPAHQLAHQVAEVPGANP